MKWYKVSERLPEKFEKVIIFPNFEIFGYYDGNCWRGLNRRKLDGIDTVTHWMHLPKGPKL